MANLQACLEEAKELVTGSKEADASSQFRLSCLLEAAFGELHQVSAKVCLRK